MNTLATCVSSEIHCISLEKTLILGKIEGRRRRGQQRMRWLDGITDLMDMNIEQAPGVGDGQGRHGVEESDTTEA